MADVQLLADTAEAKKWLGELESKVKSIKDGDKVFGGVLAATVFSDVIDHFEQEQGSKGAWQAWSKVYAEHMAQIGKSGNQILQDSGRLRQAFQPSNYRRVSEGLLWFNPAKTRSGFAYAAGHDEGGGRLPKRDFMWLSDGALGKIESATLAFILGE